MAKGGEMASVGAERTLTSTLTILLPLTLPKGAPMREMRSGPSSRMRGSGSRPSVLRMKSGCEVEWVMCE